MMKVPLVPQYLPNLPIFIRVIDIGIRIVVSVEAEKTCEKNKKKQDVADDFF